MLKSNIIQIDNPFQNLQGLTQVWPRSSQLNLPTTKKLAVCERYGGMGVGVHGGGARSVIIEELCYKGTGLNPLAGISKNANYSHGTLNLFEACYEATFSEMLGSILPIGTVKCHSVLSTGKDQSYFYKVDYELGLTKTYGGILVRDACERPAHFLRAGAFNVQDQYKEKVCDDVSRIRSVIKESKSTHLSTQDFIRVVDSYLSACANQFAFARIAGLMHGAVSPSNMTIEGKWLDLSTSTFVDRGRNYLISSSTFYDEAESVLHGAAEWMYTYGKYTSRCFNFMPLVDKYRAQIQNDTLHHLGYVLGLPRNRVIQDEVMSEYLNVANHILEILMAPSRVFGLDHLGLHRDDPLRSYLIQHSSLMAEEISGSSDNSKLLSLFALFHQKSMSSLDLIPYIQRSMIKAMKRSSLSAFFYKSFLGEKFIALTKDEDIFDCGTLIDDSLEIAKWVFNDDYSDEECICDINGMRIIFCCISSEFQLCLRNASSVSFDNFSKLTSSVEFNAHKWEVWGFDFMPYLKQLEKSPLFNLKKAR